VDLAKWVRSIHPIPQNSKKMVRFTSGLPPLSLYPGIFDPHRVGCRRFAALRSTSGKRTPLLVSSLRSESIDSRCDAHCPLRSLAPMHGWLAHYARRALPCASCHESRARSSLRSVASRHASVLSAHYFLRSYARSGVARSSLRSVASLWSCAAAMAYWMGSALRLAAMRIDHCYVRASCLEAMSIKYRA
jgi:hypothetical protein